MAPKYLVLIVVVVAITLVCTNSAIVNSARQASTSNTLPDKSLTSEPESVSPSDGLKAEILESFGNQPLSFETNRGQVDEKRQVPGARRWIQSLSVAR